MASSSPSSRKCKSREPTRLSPKLRMKTSTTSSTTERGTTDELYQLHGQGDQLQDRLLRPWPLRQNDEPPVHLRAHQSRRQRQDDLPCHGNGAHPLLRFSASLA